MNEKAYYAMKELLMSLSVFRESCHNYDRDNGQPLRPFDEECIELMENLAQSTLAQVERYENEN